MALVEAVIGLGLAAARPAAGSAGRLYYATDTRRLARDNGASWDDLAVGPDRWAWNTVSLDTVLADGDRGTLADATGGTVTVTLPSAVGKDTLHSVKKIDTSGHAVLVAAATGEDVDGAGSVSLPAQGAGVTVASDGSAWWIVAAVGL